MAKEIERKFLVSGFPISSKDLLSESIILQGYISTNPEIRIRKKERILTYNEYNTSLKRHTCDNSYRLELKSEGDLYRNEIGTIINENFFNSVKEMINKPLIEKIYREYKISDELYLEISLVDKDAEHSFYYAEVEFLTEEEAHNFDVSLIPNLIKEVTYDEEYKMKNYWKRTREEK